MALVDVSPVGREALRSREPRPVGRFFTMGGLFLVVRAIWTRSIGLRAAVDPATPPLLLSALDAIASVAGVGRGLLGAIPARTAQPSSASESTSQVSANVPAYTDTVHFTERRRSSSTSKMRFSSQRDYRAAAESKSTAQTRCLQGTTLSAFFARPTPALHGRRRVLERDRAHESTGGLQMHNGPAQRCVDVAGIADERRFIGGDAHVETVERL